MLLLNSFVLFILLILLVIASLLFFAWLGLSFLVFYQDTLFH